jgi:hypothetical protein
VRLDRRASTLTRILPVSISTSPARTISSPRAACPAPTEHRPHASHELAGAERLDHVVVGAELGPTIQSVSSRAP